MHKIQIQVVKAILTRYTDRISEMDPYVTVTLGQQTYKTTVLREKGDMPQWNEKFNFFPAENWAYGKLIVTVKDEDVFKDDIIGAITIDLAEELQNDNQFPKWYSLKYKKKPAGKILLRISQIKNYVSKMGYDYQNKTTQQSQQFLPPRSSSQIQSRRNTNSTSKQKSNLSFYVRSSKLKESFERIYGSSNIDFTSKNSSSKTQKGNTRTPSLNFQTGSKSPKKYIHSYAGEVPWMNRDSKKTDIINPFYPNSKSLQWQPMNKVGPDFLNSNSSIVYKGRK